MVKAHFILKQFSYEKGFSDPSSTIYYCKNRFIFLVKIQEFLNLLLSSDNFLCHNPFVYFAANIQKISFRAK